jgi:hypothetical protein
VVLLLKSSSKGLHLIIKIFVLIDFMPSSILVFRYVVFGLKIDNLANLNCDEIEIF